jgi:hypothetical protein
MFQTKVVENIKKHFYSTLFRKLCIFLDDVKKYYRAGQATDESITPLMRIAFWVPKATNTHLEYVILSGFPLQPWLYERASMLRYTYIARLVLGASCFSHFHAAKCMCT